MKTKQFSHENFPPEIQAIADSMNVEQEAVPPFENLPLPFDENTAPSRFTYKIRPKLLRYFEDHIYGYIPPRCNELIFRKTSEGMAFDGLAIRREIDIICRHNNVERVLHLLLYLPADRINAGEKVPVFFGLNVNGNHTCTADPEVTFFPFDPDPDLIPGSLRWADRHAAEDKRGIHAARWEFERVLKSGFATATICYLDIYPDHPHGWAKSIMPMFYTREQWDSPGRDSGAICAWAWGIMRGIDCLETQKELDLSHLAVHGHSRLGKTALLAGVYDSRIALTVPNCSGACGIKLMRHYFGENFHWLHYWNAHWFRGDFGKFAGHDCEIDFDFHFLAAAVAPRLLYVADGSRDIYADPEGEFMSVKAASGAWHVFGAEGLGNETLPPCGRIVGKDAGFYLREGSHDFTPENWAALIRYASEHFFRK